MVGTGIAVVESGTDGADSEIVAAAGFDFSAVGYSGIVPDCC